MRVITQKSLPKLAHSGGAWRSPSALFALLLISAVVFTSAKAQEGSKSKPEPLMIQEQGSFAVGGSVITTPGTFDPIKQGAFNPAGMDSAGQTLHGDHAYVFYQLPVNARKFPLVFWHGHGQSGKTWGILLRTGAKGSKTSFCGVAFRFT